MRPSSASACWCRCGCSATWATRAIWAGFATAPIGILPVLLTPFVGKYATRFDLRMVASFAFVAMGNLLVDGRNFIDPQAAQAAGLIYEAIGRPSSQRRQLMQALILAGGEGTRLRPLTSTVPKPVVPLVDRPFIAFMLDWLRGHGVDDVIMSCGFLASGVRNVLGDGSGYGMRLRYVEEPQPLGTGGALKFAESLLDERFLMLNGDVLTDLDLTRPDRAA